MAVLIPRKQIEEQNDITGSFRVGGDLSVTGSAVIGGSFAADSEFFLGNQLTDRGEITGSVFLTGSLTVDGDFSFEDVNRVLNVTASQALQSQDTFRYGGILARDFGANVPTLYVSATDGDDNNDGRSIQFPVRTVKKAAQLATPGFDGRYGLPSGSAFSGYVIRVQAGTYIEDNPVILPKNATIWGSGLRITKINARNPEQDLFHVNSGCYVAEVTMGGLRLFPNQIEPERGFAIAYQPGAFITTSPYIQNCSQISNQENSFAELYEDIPPGGGGLYVNGDAVHPDSPLASMVLDAYTQISPNGVGCLVNGRGFIQLVSFFTNFSYYAIRVNNGGHATLNNSNISFGLFGMYASGSRKIDSYEGGNEDAKQRVRESYSIIVDVLNKGLEEGLPDVTTLNTDAGIKVTPFTQSFSNNLATQKEINQVGEDFRIISRIVETGPNEYPTLLAKSSNIGYDINNPYNISGGTQFTSSLTVSAADLLQISSSYRDLLSIFADGTGSFTFKSNNEDVIKINNLEPVTSSLGVSASGSLIYDNVSSSFDTVIKIVNGGRLPQIISNTSASLYLGSDANINPILPLEPVSSSIVSSVSSSFSIIYNILNNGTGSPILDVPQNHQTNFEVTRGVNNSAWIVNGGIQNNPNTGSNVFTVTNNGSGNYVINGQVNPTLTLVEGETYTFNIAATGHPFWIKTTQTLGTGDQYNDGVTNNGTQNGTITFVVPIGAPTLYYNCQFHSSMKGTINIVEAGEEIPPIDDAEVSNVNPTITLFRGTKYIFNVSGSFSKSINRFFIRKEPISGFLGEIDYSSTRNLSLELDYNDGVINNGDDFGVVTFTVPFNAPNELYYVSQNSPQMVGKFNIVNNSATPFDLIRSTMTYPTLVNLSQSASLDVDISSSYNILTNNLDFLKTETINYISSSWNGFEYDSDEFSTDIEDIVNTVANDLLFGGNSGSIAVGLEYYLQPTIESKIQKDVTLTAIKFLSDTSQNLLRSSSFELIDVSTDDRYGLWESILKSKPFIQAETITFLSSSWSEFEYNEVSCSRDTGFILNAVATDLLYGGNERSVEAGDFYYRFPSITTTEQLSQTIDGIRYAGGTTLNIVEGNEFQTPQTSTSASVALLRTNRGLIQNETIQFINATFPTLVYNQDKCRRDTGFILDAIITDLLYGGNERSINAGNFYYQFPSIAISTQRRETSAGIQYSKILADFIVQNFILETPRVSSNTEVGIKITNEQNFTSSLFGTEIESSIVKSNFGVIGDIIRNGVGEVKLAIAKNKRDEWSVTSPLNVSDITQFTTTQSLVDFREEIGDSFQIVASIVSGGLGVAPPLEKSINGLVKVNDIQQITGSFVEDYVTASLSSSFGLVVNIISNGVGVIPTVIPNTDENIFVGNILPHTGSFINPSYITSVSQSYSVVTTIISGGLDVSPNVVKNTTGNVRTQNVQLFSSSLVATNVEADFISSSFDIVLDILENGTGSLPTLIEYTTPSTSSVVLNAYNNIKNNIPFIQAETIAYLTSSWSELGFNALSYSKDIGLVVSGAAEDLLFSANSSSISNGKYFFEFSPTSTISGSISPNIDAQLFPTLEAIRYASELTQKVILNTPFVRPDDSDVEVANLLVTNKEFLRTEAIEYISSSWSFFNYNDLTCKRDIGFIIDGIVTDLIYGGNERTVNAGEYYYDIPSQATGTQLIQTLEAINYVSSLSQKLIEGVQFVTPDGDAVEASRLLLLNNELIGSEVVSYVSSSWSNVTYNELSCSRDVKHIIDAARTDLVYGGNERSVRAGEFYFLYPSRATVGGIPSEAAQLDPTVTGIEYGSDLAQEIVLSRVLTLVTSSKLDVVDVVRENIQFIKDNTIEYVNAFYPFLQYNEASCSRDVGFILDGVLTDLTYGGNQRSITSGDFYYRFPSPAITSAQKAETVDGIIYAGSVTKLVSINQLIDDVVIGRNIDNTIKVTSIEQFISTQSGSQIEVSNVSSSFATILDIVEYGVGELPQIIDNTENTIKVTDITQFTSSSSALPNDIEFVSSSFGIVLDIVKNGSGSYEPTPYGTASTDVNTVAAYNLLRDNIPFIQGETIAYISSSWSDFEYNDLSCSRDIGFIVSGAAEDLLHGVDSASIVNGKFYFEFPSSATVSGSASPNEDAQLFPTLDGIRYAARLSDKIIQNIVFQTASLEVSASNVLIVENKQFIKEETISYLSSSWSDFDYNETTCKRDIGFILDAVRTDLVYGGNERSVTAGDFYYRFPSAAILSGSVSPTTATQLFPTLDGIRYAGNVSQKLVGGSVFQTASLEVSASVDLIRKNRTFIRRETIEYVSSSWSQVVYNEESCSRDTGFLIDAAVTDLLYGGEERSVNAGDFYYRFPSRATVKGVPSEEAQLDPTLTGVRYAGDLSSKIVLNQQFTFPSQSVLNGRSLLLSNKQLIQKETIAFLSSSWSGLNYNEVSCSRDLGFIIDAVSTDLVYGGNESSIQAGFYYYIKPSVAIIDSYADNFGQRQQTVDGINFARGVAEKVVAQTQLVFPGARRLEAAQRLVAAKDELKRRALSYTNGAFPNLVYNEASCSRDTGLIVDALATDLIYGGNERGIEAATSYFTGQYGSAATVVNEQRLETLETNRYLRTRAEFIVANAPKEDFGSLIVATGIDYSYNGSGVTFKALPPNQGGGGIPNPEFEITELGGGRIFFTSGNQDGDFRIGTGLTINQATGTLVGRTFSKSLFSLVTPFSLALEG